LQKINNNFYKLARHQWLTPISLATQEAEIKRMEIRYQANSLARFYLKNTHHKKERGEVGRVA
jgi:hypothetical protein